MPGVTIRERTQRLARTLPTDTAVLFLTGLTDKGPANTPVLIQGVAEFEKNFGTRQTYSSAWDVVDSYFAAGGNKLYFSRVVGPAATTATVNLLDASAGISLVVTALGQGVWGASLNVQVTAGDAAGEFKIAVTHDTDTSVNEVSPSLATQADAIAWAETSDYIRLTLGASALDPAVVGVTSLTGGNDDRNNIVDAQWLAALNAFNKDLGPGQVAAVNRTTSVAHGQLLDHAATNNRKALLDTTDTAVKATMLATVTAVKALGNARHGALFGPWVNMPALTPGAGARPVPLSGLVAGTIAYNEARGASPNQPSAGDRGILDAVVGLRATFSDTDAAELNEAGVNLARQIGGLYKIYGWRTAVNKISNPLHWTFSNQRLYMAIAAKANNIGERYVLHEIDGRGLVFRQFQGDLISMLIPYWEAGSLYGESPEEAFYVDVGPQVNTAESIQEGQIKAAIELTMSPFGETVVIDITRRLVAAA